MSVKTSPLAPVHAPVTALPLDVAVAGPLVPPIERLRHMSAAEWADFVLEWAHSLKSRYARVERCDGAGDMGRDVVAFESVTNDDPWDNYQCKHYTGPLAPSDVWVELGKLAYYTLEKAYTLPRRYVFVAPRGAGNRLSTLLRKPQELRRGLLEHWDKHCRRKITSTKDVVLDAALEGHINKIDFSIFSSVAPLILLEGHRCTAWHAARFGGGLPPRAIPPLPPAGIATGETNYVRALLDAYEERLGTALRGADDLADSELTSHFGRSRREFYSAESLRAFSRDNVPAGTFEGLLDEVHDGVIDVIQATHRDAYERVLAAVRQAKALQLTANALVTRTRPSDRGGMCHQLANDLRVKWRR